MIKININISFEDLADMIIDSISTNKLHYADSIYQLLTEYPNEVKDIAKQFNISRNLMMAIIFDYDQQITDQLKR